MAKITMVPSIDPAACDILEYARHSGDRHLFQPCGGFKPCTIGNGQSGVCCKNCYMGPCRITKDGQVGICGATVDDRRAEPGACDCRWLGRTLTTAAIGLHPGGRRAGRGSGLRSPREAKLYAVVAKHGIPTKGRSIKEITLDVAKKAICEFGQQRGQLSYLSVAPPKRQAIWKEQDVNPAGVDRMVVESMHRTPHGRDHDYQPPAHARPSAPRWPTAGAGSHAGPPLSDILFGTPSPGAQRGEPRRAGGEEVNIIVHGHEPALSEMMAHRVQPTRR